MDEFITANNKQQAILQSLAKIFVTVHMIDIKQQTFYKVECADYIDDLLKLYPIAQEAFDKVIEYLVVPKSVEKMTEFLNISTLRERMLHDDVLMCDFVGTVEKWCRGYFIALTRDEDGLVEQVVFAVQNIDAEKSKEETLKKISETDGLTGLLNRHALNECYRYIVDTDLTMIMMDIDCFKYFNDTFGHDVGDAVIQTCAEIILDEFSMCRCYRYGGDEYLILAINQDAHMLHEHLDSAIHRIEAKRLREDIPSIKISYGIMSGRPADKKDVELLFRQADQFLYEEKRRKFCR